MSLIDVFMLLVLTWILVRSRGVVDEAHLIISDELLGLGVSKGCGIREPRQVRVCSKQDMECATQRCLRHLDSSYHGIGKQTGPIIPLTEL